MSKKKHSIADRLGAGLRALGYTESPCSSRKYQMFRQRGYRNYFVGKSGALRCGDTASGSWSMGCPGDVTPTYRKVLREGDKALASMDKALDEIKVIVEATRPPRKKLLEAGIPPSDIAILNELAQSDPVLARALENL
jgi:hypothetical protein